jgi:hypothetical protein
MATVDLGAAAAVLWSSAPVGSAVAISITRPDGIAGPTPPVTGDAPAVQAMFIADMPGRWLIRWTAAGSSPGSYTDVLDVWPADPRFIIGLDDARAALNMQDSKTTAAQLDDLRLYIAAATPVIEDIVGPVIPGTFTQTTDGGGWAIPLFNRPTEIVSVTELGAPLDPSAYFLDSEAGILYAGRPQATRRFMPGYQSVVVEYKAGAPAVPPNIRLATRELVRHWWQLGKQGTGGGRGGSFDQTAPEWTPSGFAVPKRVIELCGKKNAPGGFA